MTFNDVIEHIPDPDSVVERAAQLLQPGGLLVINVPVSDGLFYRTATALRSVGVRQPLDRMWQRDFPSPHLSYFRPDHLERLATRHRLVTVHRAELRSVQVRGLWSRIRYDRSTNSARAALTWAASVALTPFAAALPSDISLRIFRRPV